MTATPTSQTATEDKEAQEYWGYLFKKDKTGTDRFKRLLRGLHQLIGSKYEPSDSTDLTPTQLAHFYRENNGNYDTLFLSTPPSAIAFIYKNLGCLHSLQPVATAVSASRFYEPTIPALKVEGWIMWETIQVLLGPDEHAGFLMSAVQKWDIKDPETGDLFPKILPRDCFPTEPDSHMTSWYEGVSDRLRKEAEEEQTTRVVAMDEEPRKQIESGERHHRRHDMHRSHSHGRDEEEQQVDSKKSALAYFRDPLFRKEDGESTVVRRKSKHPSIVQRGKNAATSVGHVVQNIASPHLWDGSFSSRERERERDKERTSSHDRDRERDRERERVRRRRTSPGDPRSYDDADNEEAIHEDVLSPRHPRHVALQGGSRRSSKTSSPIMERDRMDTPRHTPTERYYHQHHASPVDHSIRHSKSHDPTPSPKEYFPPYDKYQQRRGSHQEDALSPSAGSQPGTSPIPSPYAQRPGSRGRPSSMASDNAVPSPQPSSNPASPPPPAPNPPSATTPGTPNQDPITYANTMQNAGFMPTASPLFATQIAKKEREAMGMGQHISFAPTNTAGNNSGSGSGSNASLNDGSRYEFPGPSSNSSSTGMKQRQGSLPRSPRSPPMGMLAQGSGSMRSMSARREDGGRGSGSLGPGSGQRMRVARFDEGREIGRERDRQRDRERDRERDRDRGYRRESVREGR